MISSGVSEAFKQIAKSLSYKPEDVAMSMWIKRFLWSVCFVACFYAYHIGSFNGMAMLMAMTGIWSLNNVITRKRIFFYVDVMCVTVSISIVDSLFLSGELSFMGPFMCLMDFVLGSGSTYMESDVREKTDNAGFCRAHFKKMYDYGNTLGNAWIMKTHMKKMMDEMWQAKLLYKTTKNSPLAMLKPSSAPGANAFSSWVNKRNQKCYICNAFGDNYDRYMKTFFEMYFEESEFRDKVNSHKGFCIPHFGDLLNFATTHLSQKQQQEFADKFFPIMEESMKRLYGDVSWLIDKFDYRYKDADWGNSREALQNCMQKLKGGYPADPVYKQQKKPSAPPTKM